jgi:hypothetical protein
MLRFLHDIYARPDADLSQQRRSIGLLLSALAVCHPTDEDVENFMELGLENQVAETGKRVPEIRKAANEVLKKFRDSQRKRSDP